MLWGWCVGNGGSITGGGEVRATEHFHVECQTSLTLLKSIYKNVQKTQKPNKTQQKITKNNKNLAKKQKNGIFIIEHKFLTVATA
jgi:hypothetical protein